MIRKLKSGEFRLYSRKPDARTGKRKNLNSSNSDGNTVSVTQSASTVLKHADFANRSDGKTAFIRMIRLIRIQRFFLFLQASNL